MLADIVQHAHALNPSNKLALPHAHCHMHMAGDDKHQQGVMANKNTQQPVIAA